MIMREIDDIQEKKENNEITSLGTSEKSTRPFEWKRSSEEIRGQNLLWSLEDIEKKRRKRRRRREEYLTREKLSLSML